MKSEFRELSWGHGRGGGDFETVDCNHAVSTLQETENSPPGAQMQTVL
jgi:hypothetical protein